MLLFLAFIQDRCFCSHFKFVIMKKTKLFPVALLLLIILTITSCNKEVPLAKSIIGIWEVQEETVLVLQNNVKKESYTDYLSADEKVFQFAEGGSGIYYENNEDYPFTYSLASSTLVISNLFVEDLQCQALVDGDVLIMSYEEQDDEDVTVRYQYTIKAYRK